MKLRGTLTERQRDGGTTLYSSHYADLLHLITVTPFNTLILDRKGRQLDLGVRTAHPISSIPSQPSDAFLTAPSTSLAACSTIQHVLLDIFGGQSDLLEVNSLALSPKNRVRSLKRPCDSGTPTNIHMTNYLYQRGFGRWCSQLQSTSARPEHHALPLGHPYNTQ